MKFHIKIISLVSKVIEKFTKFQKNTYFGFIRGHDYLTKKELYNLKKIVGKYNIEIEKEFEDKFAQIIGKGSCISYAAARMGLYEIMRFKNISDNDEVIILGSTCSVMINAIKRNGAIPIYSDIDLNTLGSEVSSIKNKINKKTKMIIAQHSFGIPCNIKPIVKLANDKKIFLLEDCALTLESSIDGKKVGNFGDAAIFSTDHSKPINSLIGGLIYSNNNKLINNLRSSQKQLPHLKKSHEYLLWKEFLFERKYRNPSLEGKIALIGTLSNLKRKFLSQRNPFLIDDFSIKVKSDYPYPCKIPSFLAALGIHEIQRWPNVKKERKDNLNRLINIFKNSQIKILNAYENRDIEIIPLRFVWLNENNFIKEKDLNKFIDLSSFWFKKPVIGIIEELKEYNYLKGMSPLSEIVNSKIMNLPCNINFRELDLMEKKLNDLLKDTKL